MDLRRVQAEDLTPSRAVGTVNFTATQTGDASYSAATPVNFSVNITGAPQTINLGTLPDTDIRRGGIQYQRDGATSGLPVTIAYVSGPATGTGSGPYTATGAGRGELHGDAGGQRHLLRGGTGEL